MDGRIEGGKESCTDSDGSGVYSRWFHSEQASNSVQFRAVRSNLLQSEQSPCLGSANMIGIIRN